MATMLDLQFRSCTATGLTEHDLDFVLAAQRALVVDGVGTLGLTHDLEFLFAGEGRGRDFLHRGMLAWRRDACPECDLWIQIAFTATHFRRRGILTALLEKLAQAFRDERLGLGVRSTNAAMLAAVEKAGFAGTVRYLFRESERSRQFYDLAKNGGPPIADAQDETGSLGGLRASP